MNKAQRIASTLILHNLTTLLVHVHHGLYRIVKVDGRDGLTDKEKAYIMKRHEMLTQIQLELSKLGQHLKTH